MKAADLLVNANVSADQTFIRERLAELIDKHNLLVRHTFANEQIELNITSANLEPIIAYAPNVPPIAAIRFTHILLMQWGYRCRCVFPKLKQPYSDIFVCTFCNKPYQEELRDE